MPQTAAQTRTDMANETLNPSRTVPGGHVVSLNLIFDNVQFVPEELYDALARKYGAAAALTTALTGTNNDLTFTAVNKGAEGNDVTIVYVDPAANNQTLSVTVSTNAITVSLATGAGGAITSTAAQVRDAVNTHATAGVLVRAANAAANDGTGVVTAMSVQSLAGGDGKVRNEHDTAAGNAFDLRITS